MLNTFGVVLPNGALPADRHSLSGLLRSEVCTLDAAWPVAGELEIRAEPRGRPSAQHSKCLFLDPMFPRHTIPAVQGQGCSRFRSELVAPSK